MLVITAIFVFCCLHSVQSHGRLMEPPARSSMWRFSEFQQYSPPINYNDNELNCGGRDTQYDLNDGRCGECGDNWADSRPRPNENQGHYGKGIISRTYARGQNITVRVELTAPHLGNFEFKVCSMDNGAEIEDQTCFDLTRLYILQPSGLEFDYKFAIDNTLGWIENTVALPADFTCEHCSFLWYYKTGNSWGFCEDGSSGLGCGPQEEFRGCADISILP